MSDILLRGRLIDADSGTTLSGLRVEAWDLNDEGAAPRYLGGDVADRAGAFAVTIPDASVEGSGSGRRPDVYLEVYDDQTLVASTQPSPLDDLAAGTHDVAIPVRLPDTVVSAGKTAKAPRAVYRVEGSVTVTGLKTPAGLHLVVTDAASGAVLTDATLAADGDFAVEVARPKGSLAASDTVATVHVDLGRPGEPADRIASGLALVLGTPIALSATVGPRPETGAPGDLDDVPDGTSVELSQEIRDEYNARTLTSIRETGGVAEHHRDLDDADTLDALVLVDAVLPDPAAAIALADAGLGSLETLATADPEQVAAIVGDLPGARHLPAAARAYRSVADGLVREAALALNAPQTEGSLALEVAALPAAVRQALRTILPAAPAQDDECLSAVGPVAYVAALVEVVERVFDTPDAAFAIEEALHLPVASMPAACASAREPISALRPVAEALAGVAGSTPADYPAQAYTALLAELGTTPAELAAAPGLPNDQAQRLADRLGVSGRHGLNLLTIQTPKVANLAETFGLAPLDFSSPADSARGSTLFRLRQDRLQRRWHVQDWGLPSKKAAYPSSGKTAPDRIPAPPPATPVADLPRPLVDPDLIPRAAVPEMLADGATANPAYTLHVERSIEIDDEATRLTGALAASAAAIPEALDPDASPSQAAMAWDTLRLAYQSGQPVADDLARLFLDASGMHLLAAAWDAADGDGLDPAATTAVADVLVEVWKRRRFDAWRDAERVPVGGLVVTLSPVFFSADALDADADAESSYRAPHGAGLAWRRTLRARVAESDAALASLVDLTRRAEQTVLPDTVQALLAAAFPNADDLALAAEQRLLIDVAPGPALRTTRADHAIDVVQQLLAHARTGELSDALQAEFGAPTGFDRVEDDWVWLATYDTWRSAMSVYIYPENAARPAVRRLQSPAFAQVAAAATARDGNLSDALDRYAAYAADLAALQPVAACVASEQVNGSLQRQLYTFATAPDGAVWWTTTHQDVTGDAAPIRPWAPVPGVPAGAEVFGAAPVEIGTDDRTLVLVARVSGADAPDALVVYPYDLERGQWASTGLDDDAVYGAPVAMTPGSVDGATGCILHSDPTGDNVRSGDLLLAWAPGGDTETVRISRLHLPSLRLTSVHTIETGQTVSHVDAGWTLFQGDELPDTTRPVQHAVAFRATVNEDTHQAYLAVVDGLANDDRTRLVATLDGDRPVGLIGAYGSPLVTVTTCTPPASGKRADLFEAHTFEVSVAVPADGGGGDDTGGEIDPAGPGSDPDETAKDIDTPGDDTRHVLTVERVGDVLALPYAVTGVAHSLPSGDQAPPAGVTIVTRIGHSPWLARPAQVWVARLTDTPGQPGSVTLVPRDPAPLAPVLQAVRPRTRASERRALAETLAADLAVAHGTERFYIEEAFLAVPLLAADGLRRRRRYADALAWMRLVYDDAAAPEHRAVYPALDGTGTDPHAILVLPDLDSFDPLDPDAVFDARPGARFRYVLARAARMLLDAADDDFSRDTPEAVAYARTRYARARRVLAHPALGEPGESGEDAEPPVVTTLGAHTAAAATARDRARLAVHVLPSAKAHLRAVAAAVSPSLRSARAAGRSDLPAPPTNKRGLCLPVGFTAPVNPVVRGLKARASTGLAKIRLGLNAAGLERSLRLRETGLVLRDRGAVVRHQPTPYRATFLIERARQLAGLAQQAEGAFLQALERFDTESFSQIQAQQQLDVAVAGVALQDLRVDEAGAGVTMAHSQLGRATLQRTHFGDLRAAGRSENEQDSLDAMQASLRYLGQGRGASGRSEARSVLGGLAAAAIPFLALGPVGAAGGAAALASAASGLVGSIFGGARAVSDADARDAQSRSQEASTRGSRLGQIASYERRAQDWAFQENLARQDMQSARLGIRAAQLRVGVVEQERLIAALQAEHAVETALFLATKFTNAELYAWMSEVLEDVFTLYVRLATAAARVALDQLAFERQQPAPDLLASDYLAADDGPDRRGLTGATRLLADLTRVEQHALDTDRRALQLVKTVSLSQQDPAAFQRFRETGLLPFALSQESFDRDHPGHYLRLVRSVSVSVVALVPPTQGIRAELLSGGLSPVVVEADGVFRQVAVRRDPERVALSSPYADSGVFDLGADGGRRYLPFEGGGVSGGWQLELPRAANAFDFGTIADVLVTVQYTAHHSDAYRAEVVDRLGRTLEAARPLSFRDDFADAWYDALNAERLPQTASRPERSTPGRPLPVRSWADEGAAVVEVAVERTDFPPNLDDLVLDHAAVYAVRADGISAAFDVGVAFVPADEVGRTKSDPGEKVNATHSGSMDPNGGGILLDPPVSKVEWDAGATATLVGRLHDGMLSSRSHPDGWTPGGAGPAGVWRFYFDSKAQAALRNDVDDLLLVLSYRATTPAWT